MHLILQNLKLINVDSIMNRDKGRIDHFNEFEQLVITTTHKLEKTLTWKISIHGINYWWCIRNISWIQMKFANLNVENN